MSLLVLILLPAMADGNASMSSNTVVPSNSVVHHSSTSAYRARVDVRRDGKLPGVKFPPATKSWEIEYEYQVPPLPSPATWDYNSQVVYQWGDVDFDAYGGHGTYKLSKYIFNQIVPQLFIGHILSGNGPNYNPIFGKLRTWAIQAQYYWQRGKHSYAQCGKIVHVNPSDKITTSIKYSSDSGEIVSTISDNHRSGPSGRSTVTIKRPFPNEPSLFSSWADFFHRAELKSHHDFIIGHPALNVETYNLDQATMCGLLPLTIESVSIPGVSSVPSQFIIARTGKFTCLHPLATLNFKH